jgi:hypothetical protein
MTPSTTQYKIKLLQSLITEDCGKNKDWIETLKIIIKKLKKEDIIKEIKMSDIDQAIKDGQEAIDLIETYERKKQTQ